MTTAVPPAPRWPLALALAVRLTAWLTISPTRFASDEDSYFAVATALLTTGQQNIFWPPVTGWLIAAVRSVSGVDTIGLLRLVWIAMDLGCLVALRRLAIRLGQALFADDHAKMTRLVLLATLGYALYLPAISHAQFMTSETPALLQTLLALILLTTPDHNGSRRPADGPSVLARSGAGLLAGTVALTRPSLLPLLIVWPLSTWRAGVGRDWWWRSTVFAAVGMLIVGAWTLRNWRAEGQFTIATNSAYNLFIGNRDLYAEDLDLFNPMATPAQIEFRRQQWSGAVAYPADPPAELQRQALAWIAAHPVTFARRAAGRLARVFAPKTDVLELAGGEQQAGVFSPISIVLLSAANAQWAVVLAGGLIGVAALLRRAPDWGRLFAATILGSLVLCTVAIAKPRYSFVFDPILLLSFAALLTSPRDLLAAIGTPQRRVLALIAVFLLWGWIAWLIFAFSSRMGV